MIQSSSSPQHNIPFGAKGFLISCEVGKEKQTARDIIRAFLDIYDIKEKPNNDGDENPKQTTTLLSVEDALKTEIDTIKEEDKIENKKFKVVDLDLRACIFILMSKEALKVMDPSTLVTKYLDEVKKTSRTRSRFIERILPIHDVCFASADEIAKHAKPLIEKYLPNVENDGETIEERLKKSTFSVIFGSRHNNSVPRMEAIDAVAQQVNAEFHKVDLGDPRIAFTLDLIKGCCALGVAPEFRKYDKYNARILAMTDEDKAQLKSRNTTMTTKEVADNNDSEEGEK